MKRHKAAKARTVAHHHKHVKPAHAHHKAATGHAHKHHKAHKHHHVAKKHKGQVHRGLALGDAVACCAAEALAAPLRLSGIPVSNADVLALHRLSGADDERGGPILAALEAASEFGLGGMRPVSVDLVGDLDERRSDVARILGCEVVDARLTLMPEQLDNGTVDVTGAPEVAQLGRVDSRLVSAQELGDALLGHGGSLILGVDLPGPHTVLATPEGWWSWGELHCPWCDFPDAVIEEAWEVSWL